jgi:oligopeptide transport system substrate-binding protein
MSSKRIWFAIGLVVIASMVLSSCAAPTPAAAPPQVIKETVVVAGTPQVVEKVITPTPAPTAKPKRPNVLHVSTDGAGDIPSLDPNVAEDTSSITIVENTMPGLTNLNEVTNVLGPGMASKWDISADGKQYTFTMREGIPWVKWDGVKKQVVKVQTCPDKDGKTKDRTVTAKDFEYGILRALKPETASPYAYVLDFVIEGAQEFTDGKITDTTKVGVKAVDDKTLVVNFKEPAAYNANIIGLWTARATPQWLIEGDDCTTARGEKWIEAGFYQSWGPYTVKEWIHDSTLTMIKNPFWPGTKEIPQAKVDEVNFVMLDAVAQMAEFESGNLDWSNVPLADMDRVKSDAKLSKMLNISPSFCTYYLGFNTTAKVVDDPRVRRALSYAIDRQALIDNVLKGNQEPAQWFARPGLVGAPTMKDHPDLGIKFDVAKAKAELDSYLKEKNTTIDKLDITLMFNTSSGHQKIAEFAQQQWKANLGLNVKLTNQEWKVYLVTTKSKDTPQIYRMGWCLDYPDANNFDREVLASGGSQNPVDAKGQPAGGFMWKNDKYEALVKQAAVEMDPVKRVDLYAQAEQIAMVDDAIMIPMYWYTTVSVTEPWVKRTYSLGGHQIYYNWEVLQQ